MNQEDKDNNIVNWQPRVILIGVAAGAVVGAFAAYLYTQRENDPSVKPHFTPGDGIKLGFLLLGLVRAIAELGAPD